MFIGLGGVALWLYIRYPCLRPRTLIGAALHVAVSFTLFALLPLGLRACRYVLPGRVWAATFVVGLLMPALCYVLLSWLWLIARLHDLGDSTPRGGHRVRGAQSA